MSCGDEYNIFRSYQHCKRCNFISKPFEAYSVCPECGHDLEVVSGRWHTKNDWSFFRRREYTTFEFAEPSGHL